MNRTIIMLVSTYKCREEDIRCFDSVSACAVHFAHEARRQYAERGLDGDDLFDAVVSDVALLFTDSTTGEDPDEVHGGDENTNYSFELRSCADFETAVTEARAADETDSCGSRNYKG